MEITAYRHRVQYYETDQMKVVHHSNYIRWFEEARTDFLEKSGFSYAWMSCIIMKKILSLLCQHGECI